MMSNRSGGARRRSALVVVAVMLAGLVLTGLPGVGWADPADKTRPSESSQSKPATPAPAVTSVKAKKATKAKVKKAAKSTKAKAKAAKAKAAKAKAAKAAQAKSAAKTTTTGKAETENVAAAAASAPYYPPDWSTRLPRTMRDEVTGDFLGRGYEQRARVEGSNLNIYDPPAKGGTLQLSTPTDLELPGRANINLGLWNKYGDVNDSKCEGCFQALDAQFHLATIMLATDGVHLYLTGTKGTNVYLDSGPDAYRSLLYVVPFDGSCASESCATYSIDLDKYWTHEGFSTLSRAVAVTTLAATTLTSGNNTAQMIAVGQTDNGVRFYRVFNGTLSYVGTFAGIIGDGFSQTPPTALAFTPSNPETASSSSDLVIGVATYKQLVYTASVNFNGGSSTLGTWERVGLDPNSASGLWSAVPLSAAWGTRTDGSLQPVVGMHDGKVYLPDMRAGNGGDAMATSPTLQGYPTAITPMYRQDGKGGQYSDYAVAAQSTAGDFLTGVGYYFLDDIGATTMAPQRIALDDKGNPTTLAASWDAFRSWFPGYKSGKLSIVNQLAEPISVTAHTSPDAGKGCWNGAAWHGGSSELVSGDPITVPAGETRPVQYTIGATTSGTDGKCSADPGAHNTAAWRGYLEIAPVGRPAETRVVNLQLNPNGWASDVSDQQGGSLSVTLENKQTWSAFGFSELHVTGPAGTPSEVTSAGPPSLTGYQLTADAANSTNVYRLDVGPTTWSVPGATASSPQAQALIPPLQVQGRADGAGDWVDVGQLMPNGQVNLSGSQATVPGATFYWENTADGETYTQFRVQTAGPNVLTSQTVDLTTLQFCYTGTKPGGPCAAVASVPDVSGFAALNTPASQRLLANGMDQVAITLGITASPAVANNDDAYNKVFYRLGSQTGELVTNLYRQDICEDGCYEDYVGVQPSVGAYLNTGGSTYGATKRGQLGGSAPVNVDYASITSLDPTPVMAMLRLKANDQRQTGAVTLNGYNLIATTYPAVSGEVASVRNGFGIQGCLGESDSGSQPTCLVAQTTAARPAVYAQPPTDSDTAPMLGLIFANRAQNSTHDLPLVWTDSVKKPLDKPALLVTLNNPAGHLWQLNDPNSLGTTHSQIWLVTHGQLVEQSICTSSSC